MNGETSVNCTSLDWEISPLMLDWLLHRLTKEEDMTRPEMAKTLYGKFGVDVSAPCYADRME